jgi:hypothetical protein
MGGGYGRGMGGYGGGGMGGYGGGMGGYRGGMGGYGSGMGGYGGGMGGYGGGMGGYGVTALTAVVMGIMARRTGRWPAVAASTTAASRNATTTTTGDLTGSYLGAGMVWARTSIPALFNPSTTLLIQATPPSGRRFPISREDRHFAPASTDSSQSVKWIDRRISLGVQSFLQKRTDTGTARVPAAPPPAFAAKREQHAADGRHAGRISRELLALLQPESTTKVKVIPLPAWSPPTASRPRSTWAGRAYPQFAAVTGAQVNNAPACSPTRFQSHTGVGSTS